MSDFKGDSRFTQRCDDGYYDDSNLLNDAHVVDESELPRSLFRERRRWLMRYEDEVQLLYETYVEVGRAIFGRAFHQLGSVAEFGDFVFKYLQPGAT
jgi:hypothetical protein